MRFGGRQLTITRDGYVGKSVSVETGKDSFRVTHLLEHPRLPSPTRVVVRMSVSESNQAVRFAIDTDNGERLHLDRLGIGNHHGAGLSAKRMFVTKFFVFEPPIEPFKLKYNYNCLRYWCFTMQNGITEMVGSDSLDDKFARLEKEDEIERLLQEMKSRQGMSA